jgi:hypothetical protein
LGACRGQLNPVDTVVNIKTLAAHAPGAHAARTTQHTRRHHAAGLADHCPAALPCAYGASAASHA